MNRKPEPPISFAAGAGWLQVVEGRTPILLIAPHGGRAGAAARARLHPRINDLHTADITRELSHRLQAHALINIAMDRNALDCNRVEDIARKAPWVLAMLAGRVEELVSRHGRALILVIHGWNVVEARIDFGLGARVQAGRLRPVAAAHLTASENFINGPLAHLCSQLQAEGILPTLGLRYPAAGGQNLLQIFTPRFSQSQLAPLRNLASLAASGVIDALQLELSVALRWPGALRDKTIALLTQTFASSPPAPASAPVAFRRPHNAVSRHRKQTSPAAATVPVRFGVELYDPSRAIGVMASMDLNGGGGARVIILFPDGRVALCTAEGKLELRRHKIIRGPVQLTADGRTVTVEFRGPALIVPDAAAYLRMEQAFETGTIDHDAAFKCALEVRTATGPICFDPQFIARGSGQAGFGPAGAEISIGGVSRPLDALGRVGVSLLGQPEQAFTSRVSLWGYLPGGSPWQALEARLAHQPGLAHKAKGRLLMRNATLDCRVEQLRTEPWLPGGAPAHIDAVLAFATQAVRVRAQPRCFMALSRPGPGGARVYTSMGFADFDLGGERGAGMFECSKAVTAPAAPKEKP
jgi:hypothetical protein